MREIKFPRPFQFKFLFKENRQDGRQRGSVYNNEEINW